jgi:gluconokinase
MPSERAPVVVVMGVSGSGKTTVGSQLAGRLHVVYGEADDFHPQSNVDKMAAGEPLDDDDRRPWLEAIGGWLAEHQAEGAVATCSALKRSYRDLLRSKAASTVFLHLHGDRQVLEERMGRRSGHFMPTSLLGSQLDILEPLAGDEQGVTADIARSPEEIVEEFLVWRQEKAGS